MDDLISRHAAIEHIEAEYQAWGDEYDVLQILGDLEDLPSAQPEIKPIDYRDCANAMLRMWIDDVVTDGEYDRIMNKLHAHWGMKNG